MEPNVRKALGRNDAPQGKLVSFHNSPSTSMPSRNLVDCIGTIFGDCRSHQANAWAMPSFVDRHGPSPQCWLSTYFWGCLESPPHKSYRRASCMAMGAHILDTYAGQMPYIVLDGHARRLDLPPPHRPSAAAMLARQSSRSRGIGAMPTAEISSSR